MSEASIGDNWKIRRSTLLLLVVVGLGSILRSTGLNRQSYWFDEGFSWEVSTLPFDAMISRLVTDFVHPPLHYLILHVWLALPFWTDQAAAGRLLAVLFGIATLPAAYWLGSELYDRQTALLATAFTALSQLAISYAQEVRPYSQMMFLTVLTTALFVHAVKHRSGAALAAAAVAAAATLGTYYYAASVLLALFVWYLIYARAALPLRWVIAACVAVVASMLPWLFSGVIDGAMHRQAAISGSGLPAYAHIGLGTPFENLAAFANARTASTSAPAQSWWRIALAAALFVTPILWCTLAGLRRSRTADTLVAIAALLAVLALLAVQPDRLPLTVSFALGVIIATPFVMHQHGKPGRDDATALLLLLVTLSIGVPLLGALASIQFGIRYILAALVPFYLLAAHAIMQIESRSMRKTWVAAALLAMLPGTYVALTAPDKEDYRSALAMVHAGLQPDDCAVILGVTTEPPQWRLYHFNDRPLPLITKWQTSACQSLWLVEYQRVPWMRHKGENVENALRRMRAPLAVQQFTWLKVVHFGAAKATARTGETQ